MAFNIQNEINKLMNSLEPEETDINKIAKVAHRSLLILSVWDAATEMEMEKRRKREKDDEKEELNDEDETKLFHEMIQKSYLEKLHFIKKTLLN